MNSTAAVMRSAGYAFGNDLAEVILVEPEVLISV